MAITPPAPPTPPDPPAPAPPSPPTPPATSAGATATATAAGASDALPGGAVPTFTVRAPAAPPTHRISPPGRPRAGRAMDLRLRVALWAAMAAAVVWTFLYQASQKDANVPEFIYVNF